MMLKKRMVAITLVVVLLLSTLFSAVSTQAASVSIKLQGTCRYDYAFEILNQVNKLRSDSGVSTLKMNQTLLNNAMQRAIEIAVKYDHTRPDGSSCFDINSKINAENITFVYATPEKAMKSWVNSSAHLANIMNKNFKSMGVGCVVHDGVYYWVQVFSKSNLTKLSTAPENTDKTFSVSLGSKSYKFSLSIPSTMYCTDTGELDVLGKNPLTNDTYFKIDGNNFTWTTSNSSVISLDGTFASTLATGTSTVSAKGTVGTVSSKIKVVEYAKGKSHQCGDNITWEYKDRTLIFSGSGDMYDYTATRNDNKDVVNTDVPWADGFNHVEKIVVQDGINYVSNCAFACFSKLNEVKLPESLTKMGDAVFAGCSSLESISIPNSVSYIGSEAFLKCASLTSIVLPKSLESISERTFFTCRALSDVSFPESLKSVGKNAFGYCNALTKVDLPEQLTHIDEYSFYGCDNITEFTVPYVVKSLNKHVFSDCKSLKKLTVLNPTTYFSNNEMFLNVPSGLTIYSYKDSYAEKYCQEKKIKFVALDGIDLTVSAEGYSKTHTGEGITDEPVFTVSGADNYVVRYSKGDTFDFANSCSSIEELGNYYRNHPDYFTKVSGYLKDVGEYPISYCVYTQGSNPTYGNITINIINCLKGDSDCDGEVTVLDASLIQLYLVGKKELQGNAIIAADFDEDNDVTVLDASAIQLKLVGKL